ncbi:Rieske [2Fe-2S] iron-sulfur domain-containing protein [Aspergillus pseudodeflectus]|uniref:Rieske [2Fe-2S] iron-sulfur domain-containing protein n=1 Tax=Aspergillus pseudodeflectus TaxID=176178 RepID=A0ABR4JY40_9EURO
MQATAFSLLIAFLTSLVFLYRLSRQFRCPAASPKTSTSFTSSNTTTTTTKPNQSATTNPDEPCPSITVKKEPPFPANWLTGKQIFDLERRALFSKTPLPLSHTSHFPTTGSYQTLNIASYALLLIRDKDTRIRGFHNVCRHRAYPVATREFGKSSVLRCRYHGWSYNSRGRLVSAPQFKGVEGFDDGENGLFEIRVGVDERGVIWGFLGGDGDGEKMKEMEGIGKGVKAGCVWVGGSVLEDVWFNWKVGLNKSRLETSLGLNQQQQTPSFVQRLLSSISFQQQQHQQPESIHLFPSTFLFTIPRSQCWLSIRFLPATENKCAVRYDVYSYRDAKDAAAQSLLRDVEENVKGLIEDLEAEYQGVAEDDAGSLLLTLDGEAAEVQTRILSLLLAHAKLEKHHGEEIYPARREPRMNTRYEQAEQRESEP